MAGISDHGLHRWARLMPQVLKRASLEADQTLIESESAGVSGSTLRHYTASSSLSKAAMARSASPTRASTRARISPNDRLLRLSRWDSRQWPVLTEPMQPFCHRAPHSSARDLPITAEFSGCSLRNASSSLRASVQLFLSGGIIAAEFLGPACKSAGC